jgi:hypothetical protein
MLTLPRTPARPTEGSVLVRLPADGKGWARALPPLPGRVRLGITVGDASLASARAELAERGYDLLAVVPGRSPGPHADILVPGELRQAQPNWFASLLLPAERIFDLRFGPVHVALRDELDVHLTPDAHPADPHAAPPGGAGRA